MGDQYKGPDYSDFAESMASGVATGAVAAMGESLQGKLKKRSKRNEVADTPMARARYADKPPKIDLRKSYPE